ncbi:MAG: hypothetical protein Q9164_006628 [Protoblastenia rupestris]
MHPLYNCQQNKQKPSHAPAPVFPEINVFLTNLRLLDLDERDDWPSVSSQILTSRDAGPNQKARIQCVEWTLYRLFEIWSPDETTNKLLPFFPPFDPLRSLNLRAALFCYLYQLKQDGALGKEVILRKTMFDDCKGEKFLELLVAFSTAVLRKVLADGRAGKKSIAGQFCLAEKVPAKEHASFLPLAIAHRVALRGVIRRKELLRARYQRFGSVLDSKDRELTRKFDTVVVTQGFLDQNIASEATVSRVAKQFDQHWQGDSRFIDLIAQGEESSTKDDLLDRPFDKHWPAVGDGIFSGDLSTSRQGLLEDLERRVAAQQRRLQHWKDFKMGMQSDLTPTRPKKQQGLFSPPARSATIDLRKEKDLVFSPRKRIRKSEWSVRMASEEPPSATMPKVMEHHLRILGEHDGTSEVSLDDHSLKQHRVLPSPPCFGRSPNNGDDSPISEINRDVVNVGDLVPLPTMNGPDTPVTTNSEHNIEDTHRLPVINEQADLTMGSQISHDINGPPSPPKMEGGSEGMPSDLAKDDARDPRSGYPSEEEQLADQIISLTLNAAPTPLKPSLSLVERTRQSMAFASPGARLTTDGSPPQPITQKPSSRESTQNLPKTQANLLERTRQSISLVPSKPKASRKSTQNSHISKAYPRNQFETPRKQTTFAELTPPEELFSPGAGYDSVFKSRPKIGLSPDASLEGSINGGDVDGGGLEDSPLGRLIGEV